MITDELDAIQNVMDNYFEGIYHGDVERLRDRVFAPDCRLFMANDEDGVAMTAAAFLERIGSMEPPSARKAPRADSVEKVEIYSEKMAVAIVKGSAHPMRFLDIMTLFKSKGQWRIVLKAYRPIDWDF